MSHRGFNPLTLFPSRVGTQVIDKVTPQDNGGVTCYDETGKVVSVGIPVKNTAYQRTIRRHEALHCIYSHHGADHPAYSPNDTLTQALEDARLHLVCSRASGDVRRDELATALIDIHNSTARSDSDKQLIPLLGLRSAAIVYAQEDSSKATKKALSKLLSKGDVKDVEPYEIAVHRALEHIKRGAMSDAVKELTPYFHSSDDRSAPSQTFPHIGKEEDAADKKDDTGFDAQVETKEAPKEVKDESLIAGDGGTLTLEEKATIASITMNIHNLAAYDNIPTFFGATEKMVPSGKRIKAKKLATIVGPGVHRIFTKTLRRKGGTVLIDASGSMSFTIDELLALVTSAPLATIAFYNAPDDHHKTGNLWIFAQKARRAADLSLVKREAKYMRDSRGRLVKDKSVTDYYGTGNVVDMQALQWLLAQPGPRYFVTDQGFTGPCQALAKQMFDNALSRKLFTQVWCNEPYRDTGKKDHLRKMKEIIDKAV